MEHSVKLPPDDYHTTVTPLWTFANHPNKEAIYEANRHYDVDYEWWGINYDYFIEQMAEKGVDVEEKDIAFSGFCSQGDGACFMKCRIDWPKFFGQLNGKYPMLRQFVNELPNPTMYHRGFYYHEYSVSISLETMYFEENAVWTLFYNRFPKATSLYHSDYYDSEDFNDRRNRYETRLRAELDELETEMAETLRGYMKDLYRDLEEDYDELTSDKHLAERFADDDFMFAENGTIHH